MSKKYDSKANISINIEDGMCNFEATGDGTAKDIAERMIGNVELMATLNLMLEAQKNTKQ
jgi:hypothetical protein